MDVLYQQFIRERQSLHNVSPRTVDGYHWAWKAFEPALAGRSSIAKAELLQRVEELRERGLCSPFCIFRRGECNAQGAKSAGPPASHNLLRRQNSEHSL